MREQPLEGWISMLPIAQKALKCAEWPDLTSDFVQLAIRYNLCLQQQSDFEYRGNSGNLPGDDVS